MLFQQQWRRLDFFGCGTSLPLKAITRPSRGSWHGSPPKRSEVSFFKMRQSIRKWIIFQKNQHFCQKNHFQRKISKKWTYFTRLSDFFKKIVLKFQFFWSNTINPEKFSVNYIILRNLSKKLRNRLERVGL